MVEENDSAMDSILQDFINLDKDSLAEVKKEIKISSSSYEDEQTSFQHLQRL